MVNPSPLFILHLKQAIDKITKTNIMNRMEIEQTIPTLFTSTCFPYIIPYRSQGTGNLQEKKSTAFELEVDTRAHTHSLYVSTSTRTPFGYSPNCNVKDITAHG